ncbi:riboflavin kinase [Trichodelitschia bisporula]|uniref:Riboflavin kinase n=1 Tax=Trichodelitschia bisporula TaxID=703511 RepID=A0A6G1IAT3_9PEZI|nr:riboflavin kinase [Trichodelitschia bisporula]
MRPSGARDAVAGPDEGPAPPFPVKLGGPVIKGFGRGSRELGIPTANIPLEGLAVGGHEDLDSGVYYGWAGLEGAPPASTPQAEGKLEGDARGTIYPMVMSIGWNPFYKNTVRSVEVHIMHEFAQDFYGRHLNLLILGFIRPEYDYVSKESLIDDIRTDIDVTRQSLARPAYEKWKKDESLLVFPGRESVE